MHSRPATHSLPRQLLVRIVVLFTLVIGALIEPVQPARADVGTNWTGSYFNNINLAGAPVLTRIDPAIVFNWGPNSPAPGIGNANWSARWQTVQYFTAGVYRFTVSVDDGVRVFIDGQLVIDQFTAGGARQFTANVQLTTGTHIIQVDYFQATGDASITVQWDFVPQQSSLWLAQYFNNPGLLGGPSLTRYESYINYYWGTGSPDFLITPDNFSVRWSSTQPFNAGTYRFTLAGDDGVRLFIDDILIIDQWRDQVITAYTIDVALSQGLHTLRVEYYERVNNAIVRFSYEPAVGTPGLPPPTTSGWYAEYFYNRGLLGSPAFVRTEGTSGINANFIAQPPIPGFPRNDFSVRYTRQVCVPGRPYTFWLAVDDGVRFYIDQTLVVDSWSDKALTVIRQPVDLTVGCHNFRVEYYQLVGDARLILTWEPPDGQLPPQPWVNPLGQTPPPVVQPPVGGVTLRVVTGQLNVRSGPGVAYNVLTRVSSGTILAALSRTSDYSFVKVRAPNGVVGWISASSVYVTTVTGNLIQLPVESIGVPPPTTGTVQGKATTSLRVRVGPGTTFTQLGTLPQDQIVEVIGRNANVSWLQVRYSGTTGWVASRYFQITSGTAASLPVTG